MLSGRILNRKYLDKGGTFQLYKLSNLNKSIPFLLHSCRELDGSERDLRDVLYGLSWWINLRIKVDRRVKINSLYSNSLNWLMELICGTFSHKLNRNSGEGNGTPLQYFCLENPMDGGAWRAVVHGVAKSRTRLSDFTFTFHFHALEKEMATHSSVLAWRTPGMEEPGGLLSMGLHRVGHDWSDLAAAAVWLYALSLKLHLMGKW